MPGLGRGVAVNPIAVRNWGGGGGSAPAPTKLLAIGDSITAYSTGVEGFNSYARRYFAAQPSLTTQISAQGGRSLGNVGNTDDGGNTAYGHLSDDLAFEADVVTIFLGANDIGGSTAGQAETYAEALLTFAGNFAAQGATIIFCTALPRDGSAPMSEVARAAFNDRLRLAVTNDEIDDLVDFDDTPHMGVFANTSDATYYEQGGVPAVHPTSLGQGELFDVYSPVVNHWFGIANEPQGFAFAAQAAAVVDTDYDSPAYTVKGLYPGETRPYSVQSGQKISKNGGAFTLDGSGTVVNGNTIAVRNRTSVDPATQTDVTATIGVTTATYTATTAGAGSRDWVPTDLGSKLKLWLKPEDIAGANASEMTTWPDSSGASLAVTGAGVASKPTVVASGLNGFKTVKILSSYNAARFTMPAGYLTGRTSGAAFFVAKLVSDPPASAYAPPIAGWGSDTSGEFYPFVNGSVYSNFGSNARNQTGDVGPSLASWRFASFHSATNDWRYYVDGTAVHTLVSNTFANGSAPQIGYDASGGQGMDGEIAEVIDCTAVLTTTERQLVEGYLAWKYGLEANLPSGHPYELERPTI